MGKGTVNKWTLGLVALLISLLFLIMIRQFIMPLILAGIFSALCYPIYNRFEKWFGGRHAPASAVTIIIVVCVVIVPLSGLLGIVASQALKIGAVAKPWITQKISEPNALSNLIQSLPFYDSIEPYRSQIITKTGELVGSMSSFIIDKVSSATIGTLNIIISVFIMLY